MLVLCFSSVFFIFFRHVDRECLSKLTCPQALETHINALSPYHVTLVLFILPFPSKSLPFPDFTAEIRLGSRLHHGFHQVISPRRLSLGREKGACLYGLLVVGNSSHLD
ncbi:hypothetical protein QBC45DRAFT_417522 [Copromyces sp. CBS 386.78]|nr:hypothetical protein QBC45DRAFT_417522 [Copromyces sp. CBS 386.78]